MKLRQWIKSRSTQEWMMIVVITMLLVMIATRWDYTARTAGEAFKQRFSPPVEQADSLPGQASAEPQPST